MEYRLIDVYDGRPYSHYSYLGLDLDEKEWQETIYKNFKETLTKGIAPRITCVAELEKIKHLINDDIESIISDLPIDTEMKQQIDEIIFSDLDIRRKRILIRKLKGKYGFKRFRSVLPFIICRCRIVFLCHCLRR